MVFYGVGNHGGGPTKANLDSIARLNAGGDCRGSSCQLAAALLRRVSRDGDLPVGHGDLQHHARRLLHGALRHQALEPPRREPAAARREVVRGRRRVAGAAYPLDELTEAWKLVLFNQFHDTLAGTSIEPAYEDARDQIGHASSIAALAFNRAVQSIARQIDDRAGGGDARRSSSSTRMRGRSRADVELEFAGCAREGAQLVDDEGAAGADAADAPLTTVLNGRAARLVFRAEVPPLGYRVYRDPRRRRRRRTGRATGTRSRTSTCSLEIDPATGRIARLVVKATGVDLAAPGAKHAVVVDDRSDTWGHERRAPTTTRSASSSARRCGSSRRARCGRRCGSRAATATRRSREDYILGARRRARRRASRARLARAAASC